MASARQPLNAEPAPSDQSLRAFDGVNFFVGGALAGFGPFVTVFLGEQDWRPEDIGFVLTVGGIAGLVAQYPSGELLDVARSKRLVLGLGISVVGLSALMMGLWPTFAVVLIALALQGSTGGFVGLAIPAVSLGLVGQPALAERLGRNQRFQSAGSLAAAGLDGRARICPVEPRYIFRGGAPRRTGARRSHPNPLRRGQLWTLGRYTRSP